MVSKASTFSVIVFPARVFTKIYLHVVAEPQRKALKAIVESWGNGTCTFNETLEDIIS